MNIKLILIALVLVFTYQTLSGYQEHKKVAAFETGVNADPYIGIAGNPKGDVTVIEFFDYKCGYCKLQENTFETLLREDWNLRIVFMELPIFGEASTNAAKAALAVNHIDSKKYFPFHNALMQRSGPLDMNVLNEEALKLGIGDYTLKATMDNLPLTEELRHIHDEAHALGIYGTPGLLINGEVIRGSLSIDQLRARIADARKAAKN